MHKLRDVNIDPRPSFDPTLMLLPNGSKFGASLEEKGNNLSLGHHGKLTSGGRAGIGFLPERFDEFGERLGAEVAFAAMADGDGAGFSFLGPDHKHVGNFLELGVADFRR